MIAQALTVLRHLYVNLDDNSIESQPALRAIDSLIDILFEMRKD